MMARVQLASKLSQGESVSRCAFMGAFKSAFKSDYKSAFTGAITWTLLSAGLSDGAVRTWTGGGANDNWSLGANWGGTSPAPGDDIHFAGSTRLTPNNDITPGTAFNSISFDAGAGPFVVGGNAVALSGGASAVANANSGGIMTLNLALTLASGSGSTFSNTVGGTLVLGGNLALGSYPLSVNALGMTDLSGVVAGTGSLAKSGNGPLKLSGSNTYSGATTVNAGVIIVNNASALGTTAAGTTVAAGAALDLNGVNYSAAEALSLNGTGPGGTGALQNTSSTAALFGGQLSLGSAAAIIGESGSIALTHTGAVSGGYPLTLSGSQGGSVSGGFNSAYLTKAGAGSWSLENDDSFGLLALSSGTLHLGTGRIHTVSSSLSLNGGNLDFGSSTLEVQGSSADFSNLASIAPASGTLIFSSASGQAFIPKSGAAFPAIVKNGSGALTLNSYGLNAQSLTMNGGNWDWSSYTHTLGSIASASGMMLFNASTVEVTGNCDLSGLSAVAGAAAHLDFTGGSAQIFTPVAGGSTHPHVRKLGAGTTTLAGNLTTSSLLVSGGTLDLAATSLIANSGLGITGGTLRADDASVSVYESVNVSGGVLRMPSGTMTVQQSFTLVSSGIVHNSGTLVMTSPAPGRILDVDGTLNNVTLNGSGGVWTVANHPLALSGTLTLSNGHLVLGNSMAHTVGAMDFAAGYLDFGTACAMAVTSGNADFSGLSALTTVSGNTVSFTGATGTQILTPRSSGTNPAIIHGGASLLRLAGTGTYRGFAQSAGVLDFNGCDIATDNGGNFSINNGAPSTLQGLGGRNIVVAGDAAWAGASAASKLNLNPGSPWTLNVAGALSAAFATLNNAIASPTAGICSNCQEGGGNSGWSFPVTWDGGAGANHDWTAAANWSSDAVPTSNQDVRFDATSSNDVNLDADQTVKSITLASAYAGAFGFNNSTLSVRETADFRSGGSISSGTGALKFTGSAAQVFHPLASATFPVVIQDGAGGTTTSGAALRAKGLSIATGTFHFAGGTHILDALSSTGGGLDLGSGNFEFRVGDVNLAGLSSLTVATNSLAFTAASGTQTFTPNAAYGLSAIAKSGAGSVVVAGNSLMAGAFSMSGGTWNWGASTLTHSLTTLTATGGTMAFGSNIVKAAGNVDLSGLTALNPGTGTLRFDGSGPQAFTPMPGGAFPDLSKTGSGTVTAAGAFTAKTLSMSNGTLVLGSFSHSIASFTATAGTLDFGTSTLNLGGGADFSGLTVLNAASGKLLFTAASGSQTFTPKTGALHPAIEHNGAGTLILAGAGLLCASFRQQAGSLDFNGRDITVSGTGSFDILNGASNTLINLGGRTLIVGGPATLMGQPANRLNLDPAAPWTLTVAGALKAVNADIRNSLASASPGLADSSANLLGNANWTFLDTLKPENVTAFQAQAVGGHSAALAWTASAASDADSVMLRYRTDGTPPQNSGDGVLWRSVAATVTKDTATGLADKTVFHFAAFARDSSGNFSLKSGGAWDSAETPDVTAPAGVASFVATALSPASISLAWEASVSPDAQDVIIRYRADGAYPADAGDGVFWKNLSASAQAETVTGLASDIVYHFAAFVRDTSGNVSPASAQARDTALYRTPVSGTLSIADDQGRLKTPMAAVAFTWSGADSLRFALPADTAFALWIGLRPLDSLSLAAGPDGNRPILAQYKNIHGLRSPWYKDSTVLDRAAPVVTLAAKAEHGWRNWPDALAGKALDAVLGTDSVFVIRKRLGDGAYFNGAGWSTAADTAKLRADSVFSVPMPNAAMTTGAYDFTAFARDRIGNVSAPLTVRVNYSGNRAPALAASTLADSLFQNQQAAWTLEVGDPDAGDSLIALSASLPPWLTLTQASDSAQGGFAVRRIYSLAGKPRQADVGNATVTIQTADLGGRIFAYTKTFKVADVNDPPVFGSDRDSVAAREDSVSGYRPHFADADPGDAHALALLQAPAWVAIKDSALVFTPGNRDAGMAAVRMTVSDGRLSDTLDLKINVANVNDAPIAFPSSNWQARPRWKEDVPDSFTVVVVDMDKGDPVSLATALPAWIQYQASVDPVDGCNRFFRFTVNPRQADTGGLDVNLRFQDAAGAASELPFSARVAAVNDTPTAIIGERRSLAGAARIALNVSDQDGNAASSRFHYRLVSASGDTVRGGICASAVLTLHPLADGAYRLAVRAEDEGGLKQSGFTVADLAITGATAVALDSGRWHMIGYPGRALPASELGTGHALATWDESSSDGSPLGRYASGPASDSLARGKGYWVRVARPVVLNAPQAGLLDRPFTLKLTHGRQGWNQIGNPFPYYADLSAAGLQFWEWDAVRRDLVNAKGILKPWGAYWVQVSRDTTLTLRNEPYFPPAQAASGALAKSSGPASPAFPAPRFSDWTLQMSLQAGPYQDRANYLGIRKVTLAESAPGAEAASGSRAESRGRVPDAPKYGDYIALHFERPGAAGPGAKTAQGDSGRYTTALGDAEDFRAGLGADEEWWDFTVENSGTGLDRASLSLPGLDQVLGSGLCVFLVKRGEAIPLTAGEPAMLAMDGGATHYSLVVTPHPDFARRLKGFFSLSQNFPNPVSAGTTFRFFLPQAWGEDGKREAKAYRLRLNVYDYSGRLAARVADGAFAPGAHSLLWRPQGRGGNALAKGAYVYRLEIPGMAKTMKMIVK
jgi:autotransporter-associated beta strand protein